MNYSQQLTEANATLSDLLSDLTGLQQTVTNLGHQVGQARQAREYDRAADLEKQRAAYQSLLTDQQESISEARGEVGRLEHALQTAKLRSQLVSLAKEATAALEQVNRRAESMSAHLLTELKCLSTDLEGLEQKQYNFDRTLRELGMNRAAFSVNRTPEQEAEVVTYLLELEQGEGVNLDAALMERGGRVQPGGRGHVRVADPTLGEVLFQLMHELRERPQDFEGSKQ